MHKLATLVDHLDAIMKVYPTVLNVTCDAISC